MIFPNHPAFEELRPGMGLGYQPGAHAILGYQPGAHAMLGYHAGSHGNLGDFSASMENAAVAAGYSTSDIDLLNNLGATDQDLSNLINGNVTLSQLYAQYGVTIPPTSTATASAAGAPTITSTHPAQPSPASPGQIPSGSTLLYTASYNPVKAFSTASTVISSIAAQLAAHGMAMVSNAVQQSGLTSQATFTMTVLDSVGHQYLTDAQSILDALLNQFTSNGRITSTVTLVSAGTTASGVPAATPASDPLTWLENNALYIGGAIAALVLINNFTGGKRR